ncbi:hypothetical protein [Synechococcus sp. L2F]|uniref:thermonuclease family protein n=1 Tax=Synechococcus sp. L2F TaxID=2823739 RepID=UPI0028F44E05|nr:hypothetical protein [Synechococcus sp. L2F]
MRRLLLLFGGLLLVVAMAPAAMAGTDSRATVLSISDGDTIRVRAQGRKITIRLACIDAPEIALASEPACTESWDPCFAGDEGHGPDVVSR